MADDVDRSTPEDDAVAAEHVRLFDLHWERIVAVWPELADGPANEAAWDSVCNLVPYGYVVVRRARFERVVAFARYFSELPESFLSDADAAEAMDGLDLMFRGMLPGDLDPLS